MATKDDILAAANAPVSELRKKDLPTENIATEALPPAGYGRQEALKIRHDTLQRLIEERGEQIAAGLLDESKLRVDPEIAHYYADILQVTNPLPNRQYCWVECGIRDSHPEHAHHKQMLGWHFVGPDDPECPSIPRSPQGHRRLGTTVLMWIDIERWIEQKAHEHATSLKQRGDMQSPDRMLDIANRHGVAVNVISNWNQLSPESRSLAEQRFTQRQRDLQQRRDRIDAELRNGTAHLHYGNRQHAHI